MADATASIVHQYYVSVLKNSKSSSLLVDLGEVIEKELASFTVRENYRREEDGEGIVGYCEAHYELLEGVTFNDLLGKLVSLAGDNSDLGKNIENCKKYVYKVKSRENGSLSKAAKRELKKTEDLAKKVGAALKTNAPKLRDFIRCKAKIFYKKNRNSQIFLQASTLA
jgi:hypothetical protein